MKDPNENRPGYAYSCSMDCWVKNELAEEAISLAATTPLSEIEQMIQAKGLTAPRVTPQRIEHVIAEEYYFRAAEGAMHGRTQDGQVLNTPLYHPSLELLTFCVLVLKNGFTVTGESACASPENFNAEVGRKAARTNAVAKIWPLEGYLLRQNLYEAFHRGEMAPLKERAKPRED